MLAYAMYYMSDLQNNSSREILVLFYFFCAELSYVLIQEAALVHEAWWNTHIRCPHLRTLLRNTFLFKQILVSNKSQATYIELTSNKHYHICVNKISKELISCLEYWGRTNVLIYNMTHMYPPTHIYDTVVLHHNQCQFLLCSKDSWDL